MFLSWKKVGLTSKLCVIFGLDKKKIDKITKQTSHSEKNLVGKNILKKEGCPVQSNERDCSGKMYDGNLPAVKSNEKAFLSGKIQ